MVRSDIMTNLSVTSLVRSYCKPFEKEKVAQRKAEKEGTTPEEILSLWDEKAQKSRELGDRVHSYIQHKIQKRRCFETKIEEFNTIESLWEEVIEPLFEVTGTEVKVPENKYSIDGRADAIVFDKETSQKCVIDWKTGNLTSSSFNNFLSPFENVEESKERIALIQTAIYAVLFDYPIGMVAHIGKDGYRVLVTSDDDIKIAKRMLEIGPKI